MNLSAVLLWLLSACIGWLINDTKGAVIGFSSMLAISLLISLFHRK